MGNLRAEVDDIRHNRAEILVFMRFDEHRGIVCGVFERIGDDIGEQLAQTTLIAFHFDVVGHVDFDIVGMPGIGDFQRFHGFVDEIREIEFIDLQARRTGFHAGQIKQKRDQIRQTVRLVENAFQIRWGRFHNAVGHVLDHGLQRGYRRT